MRMGNGSSVLQGRGTNGHTEFWMNPMMIFASPSLDLPEGMGEGCLNLAAKKPVRGSDPDPFMGDYALVTDGNKDAKGGTFVELRTGTQWVQIDHDNSSGLGVGEDKEYIDTFEGRLVEVEGMRARYLRLYSSGNTTDNMNDYIEVEIFGLRDQ